MKFKFSKKIYLLFAGITLILLIWVLLFAPKSANNLLPNHFISYEFVKSQPEIKTYYPNSHVVSVNGSSQHITESGWGGAWAGVVFESNDSPEKIYQWYEKLLTAQGWQKDSRAVVGLASTQISLQSYTKDGKGLKSKETFYIAIDDSKSLSWTLGKKLPADMTIFEVSYYIKPN